MLPPSPAGVKITAGAIRCAGLGREDVLQIEGGIAPEGKPRGAANNTEPPAIVFGGALGYFDDGAGVLPRTHTVFTVSMIAGKKGQP